MEDIFQNAPNKFSLLMKVYEEQVDYLRWLSGIDFKILGVFLTLQTILGGFVVRLNEIKFWELCGICLFQVIVGIITINLFLKNSKRRKIEVEKFDTVMKALYLRSGDKFPNVNGKGLFPKPEVRSSLGLYIIMVCGTAISIFAIAFSSLSCALF